MENIELYLGLAALLVIAIIGINSKSFRARLTKGGLNISGDNQEKDKVLVEKVKDKSDIDVESRKNQNIHISEIEKSKVKIKK